MLLGALSIVKFLIEKCQVNPNPVDRFVVVVIVGIVVVYLFYVI